MKLLSKDQVGGIPGHTAEDCCWENHCQIKDQAGKAAFRRKSETPPWPGQHKKGYWGKEKKKNYIC